MRFASERCASPKSGTTSGCSARHAFHTSTPCLRVEAISPITWDHMILYGEYVIDLLELVRWQGPKGTPHGDGRQPVVSGLEV